MHIGVNNLPKVVQWCLVGSWTHDILIASPAPYQLCHHVKVEKSTWIVAYRCFLWFCVYSTYRQSFPTGRRMVDQQFNVFKSTSRVSLINTKFGLHFLHFVFLKTLSVKRCIRCWLCSIVSHRRRQFLCSALTNGLYSQRSVVNMSSVLLDSGETSHTVIATC